LGGGGEVREDVGVVGGEVDEVEEQYVSGNENLQKTIQPDRKQDALPVIQGEKKPWVSCWSQKSTGCEKPGIGLYCGLEGGWDDELHLYSFLPGNILEWDRDRCCLNRVLLSRCAKSLGIAMYCAALKVGVHCHNCPEIPTERYIGVAQDEEHDLEAVVGV
jgi:hypothetical protein